MLLDPQVNANALTWAADTNKARTSTNIDDGLGSSLVRGVELRGFEPLTFSLRTRRATSCAIAPCRFRGTSKSYTTPARRPKTDRPPAYSPTARGSPSSSETRSAGLSAITGRNSLDATGADRSIVRTERGSNGRDT